MIIDAVAQLAKKVEEGQYSISDLTDAEREILRQLIPGDHLNQFQKQIALEFWLVTTSEDLAVVNQNRIYKVPFFLTVDGRTLIPVKLLVDPSHYRDLSYWVSTLKIVSVQKDEFVTVTEQ